MYKYTFYEGSLPSLPCCVAVKANTYKEAESTVMEWIRLDTVQEHEIPFPSMNWSN